MWFWGLEAGWGSALVATLTALLAHSCRPPSETYADSTLTHATRLQLFLLENKCPVVSIIARHLCLTHVYLRVKQDSGTSAEKTDLEYTQQMCWLEILARLFSTWVLVVHVSTSVHRCGNLLFYLRDHVQKDTLNKTAHGQLLTDLQPQRPKPQQYNSHCSWASSVCQALCQVPCLSVSLRPWNSPFHRWQKPHAPWVIWPSHISGKPWNRDSNPEGLSPRCVCVD